MGRLIDGKWNADAEFADKDGHFRRQATTFRDWVLDEPGARHAVEAGRYHLYVSYACPWAHRTLVARALLGLQDAISISVVDPLMGRDGWVFGDGPGCIPDPIHHAKFLRDVYLAAKPDFTGRVTVPVLWDRDRATIVSNESREILRMLATVFRPLATRDIDLSPRALRAQIDAVIDDNYESINNGVYKAGFARSQQAYDAAIDELFAALERCEATLHRQRFLCGPAPTEADIALFTTLVRFDLVYHTHFKCNVKRIVDLPSLWGFVRDVYRMPGVAETCNFDHIKQHYYRSHGHINPSGIVARGPELDFGSDPARG